MAQRNGHNRWDSPEDEKFQQKRKIRTGLSSGWRYSTFCKTQYSSGAQYGGIPNFVRCHLSVIHLLDRIAQLPTMTVEIDDEGKYGRSYYTDDPYAEKRVYTWHEGKYNVKALVEEVGEWNQMLAVMSGAINGHARNERVVHRHGVADLGVPRLLSTWSSRGSRTISTLSRFCKP